MRRCFDVHEAETWPRCGCLAAALLPPCCWDRGQGCSCPCHLVTILPGAWLAERLCYYDYSFESFLISVKFSFILLFLLSRESKINSCCSLTLFHSFHSEIEKKKSSSLSLSPTPSPCKSFFKVFSDYRFRAKTSWLSCCCLEGDIAA